MLSPHRDDAAFSLCLSMSRWACLGMRVRVVNFFTQSAYAPRAAVQEAAAISLLRESEDRAALFAVDLRIETKSFRFLDAPLRLSISAKEVFSRPPDHSVEDRLIAAISGFVRNNLILSPLGLGDHVDHLAVRSAAVSACRRLGNLGFYEDLPYAIWTTEKALNNRVEESGASLRPIVIPAEKPFWAKRRIVARYRSQITPQEADLIARFASRYGGERIWIPNRLARVLRQTANRDRSTSQKEQIPPRARTGSIRSR
ncbi:MAG TPA: PIG-L family deacetylase [Bryobacteraceae bacterium]